MDHSQDFDKIDRFLKPILNIFILRNIFIDLGEVLIVGRVGFIKVRILFRTLSDI